MYCADVGVQLMHFFLANLHSTGIGQPSCLAPYPSTTHAGLSTGKIYHWNLQADVANWLQQANTIVVTGALKKKDDEEKKEKDNQYKLLTLA